jgi:predicted aspartyl protease
MEVLSPADMERSVEVRFIVDSGATYSVVPRLILRGLGIEPHTEQKFYLANGEQIIRQKGTALFRLGERRGGADVIFGEEGDVELLGVLTLESLGLALDPLRRELKNLRLMLA